MTSKRLFQILTGTIVLLILSSIASVYFGQQILREKNKELQSQKVKTAALEQQERSLIEAKEEIELYSALASVAKSIVPQEKDQALTIREVVAIAEQSGVKISTISFPTSELGEKANSKDKKSDQQSTTATQLKKVEGIPGLSQLELTVSTEPTNFMSLIKLLGLLEQNRRTSAISSITITPDGDNTNQLNVALILQVYIKP